MNGGLNLISDSFLKLCFSTFPFLSCRLISTLSRCHPGFVPLLSCPILIFSITSPISSSWEKTIKCSQGCTYCLIGCVVKRDTRTSTINMSLAPLSKYRRLSLLLTHRCFCWVHNALRPYKAIKTSASVPAPKMSLVNIFISYGTTEKSKRWQLCLIEINTTQLGNNASNDST